ncbi:hypothetical protein ACSQ67_006077 [Phaseolus vulgaris]
MAKPPKSHLAAIKRILKYLKGTLYHGLHIQPAVAGQPYSLQAFCDVDWAVGPDDRRSTHELPSFLD